MHYHGSRFFTTNYYGCLLWSPITSRITTQIFLTIWASQTTNLTSWFGLFSCFTYCYWAYSPTFSYFKIQAHNPYFLSISIHEMASLNCSPYLHKVGFGEMFKANLFSKYHELLCNESVMTINFLFYFLL